MAEENQELRLTCLLPEKSASKVREMRTWYDLTTNVAVLRKALSILYMLATEARKGGDLQLVRADGTVLLLTPLVAPEGSHEMA